MNWWMVAVELVAQTLVKAESMRFRCGERKRDERGRALREAEEKPRSQNPNFTCLPRKMKEKNTGKIRV